MIHAAEFFVSPPHQSNFRLAPLEVSRLADRVTNNLVPQVDLGADNFEVPGARRQVLYVDAESNIRQELTLQLVQHEGGAWTDLDLAGMTNQTGVTEGRFLTADGTMSAAAVLTGNVRGGLFGAYFETNEGRRRAATTPAALTGLSDGDWYWVVIGGPYEFLGAASTAAGLPLGFAGVVGEVGKLEDHTVAVAAASDQPVAYTLSNPGAVDQFGTCIIVLDRLAQADGLF